MCLLFGKVRFLSAQNVARSVQLSLPGAALRLASAAVGATAVLVRAPRALVAVVLRRMRRDSVRYLRSGRDLVLLLSELSLRGPERERTRGEESVSPFRSITPHFSLSNFRCARSCFQCPHCDNGLTVIGSDPAGESDLASAAASIGEAPFSLSCSVCKWNSTEVGIVFDKATTLGCQSSHSCSLCVMLMPSVQYNSKKWKRSHWRNSNSTISRTISSPSSVVDYHSPPPHSPRHPKLHHSQSRQFSRKIPSRISDRVTGVCSAFRVVGGVVRRRRVSRMSWRGTSL